MNEGNSELAELASESEQLDRLHDEVRQSRTSITKKIAAVMVRCHIDFRELREAYREQIQAARPTTGRHRKRTEMYRDPVSGKPWAGVGRMPVWLRNYVEKGRSKEGGISGAATGAWVRKNTGARGPPFYSGKCRDQDNSILRWRFKPG
jgi:DNA-binding protein H-NS